jgi:hypothetical protein
VVLLECGVQELKGSHQHVLTPPLRAARCDVSIRRRQIFPDKTSMGVLKFACRLPSGEQDRTGNGAATVAPSRLQTSGGA